MSDQNEPVEGYLQIVATVREYVEEQIQLGFTELIEPEEEPEFAEFDIERLRDEAMGCERCELHQERNTVVFGTGDENADLMFVGEAPGAEEDLQGIPFVGRAGQLLTRIIEAMELTREDVYIANVIKCRPPGNRNPKPIEIETCEPFLLRQIELIKPKVICALGTFGAQTLLRTKQSISSLRGRFPRLSRLQAHGNLPPRLPPPQSACQTRCLGRHAEGNGGTKRVVSSLVPSFINEPLTFHAHEICSRRFSTPPRSHLLLRHSRPFSIPRAAGHPCTRPLRRGGEGRGSSSISWMIPTCLTTL